MDGLLPAMCVAAAYVNDAPFKNDWIPVAFSVLQGWRGVSDNYCATYTRHFNCTVIGCGCELFKATIWNWGKKTF